eukprot:gene3978-4606_t
MVLDFTAEDIVSTPLAVSPFHTPTETTIETWNKNYYNHMNALVTISNKQNGFVALAPSTETSMATTLVLALGNSQNGTYMAASRLSAGTTSFSYFQTTPTGSVKEKDLFTISLSNGYLQNGQISSLECHASLSSMGVEFQTGFKGNLDVFLTYPYGYGAGNAHVYDIALTALYSIATNQDTTPPELTKMEVQHLGTFSKVVRVFAGEWNVLMNMYIIPFTIPINIPEGPLNYILATDPYLKSAQLTHFRGGTVYVISNGPMVVDIKAFPTTSVITSSPSVIGWDIEIEDRPNGFREGRIEISSDFNPVAHTFNFTPANRTPGDTIYRSVYSFRIPLLVSYRIEQFTFQLTLMDMSGNVVMSNPPRDVLNISPLFKVLQDPVMKQQLIISANTVSTQMDPTPPTICDFKVLETIIDVEDINNVINVSFNVCDTITGVHPRNTPTVYLNSIFNDHIGGVSELVTPIVGIVNNAAYTCKINVPYGFGALDKLFFSIHGLMDNMLNINGFSSSQLAVLGYVNSIQRVNSFYLPQAANAIIVSTAGLRYINSYFQQGRVLYSLGGVNCSFRLKIATLSVEPLVNTTWNSEIISMHTNVPYEPGFFVAIVAQGPNTSVVLSFSTESQTITQDFDYPTWNVVNVSKLVKGPYGLFATFEADKEFREARACTTPCYICIVLSNENYKVFTMILTPKIEISSCNLSSIPVVIKNQESPMTPITLNMTFGPIITSPFVSEFHTFYTRINPYSFSLTSLSTVLQIQDSIAQVSTLSQGGIGHPFFPVLGNKVKSVFLTQFYGSIGSLFDIIFASMTPTGVETQILSTLSNMESDTIPPVLNKVEVLTLGTYSKVIRVYFTDNQSGMFRVTTRSTNAYESDLAWGNITNGVVDFLVNIPPSFIYDFDDYLSVSIQDLALKQLNYLPESFLPSLNLIPLLYENTFRDITDITYFQFDKTVVNVTNQNVLNQLSFNVTNADIFMRPQLILTYNPLADYQLHRTETFTGMWNNDKQLYVISFIIPMNIFEGELLYTLFTDPQLSSAQMSSLEGSTITIISNYCDQLGPLLSNLTAIPGTNVEGPVEEIGWDLEIEDWPNGFKDGYMVIQSDYNPIVYSFNFTSANRTSGDIYKGVYSFRIPLVATSRNETFSFQLTLNDLGDNIAISNPPTNKLQITPFFKQYAYPLQLKITTSTTVESPDTVPPYLCSFKVLNTTVDVGSPHRSIHVDIDCSIGSSKERTALVQHEASIEKENKYSHDINTTISYHIAITSHCTANSKIEIRGSFFEKGNGQYNNFNVQASCDQLSLIVGVIADPPITQVTWAAGVGQVTLSSPNPNWLKLLFEFKGVNRPLVLTFNSVNDTLEHDFGFVHCEEFPPLIFKNPTPLSRHELSTGSLRFTAQTDFKYPQHFECSTPCYLCGINPSSDYSIYTFLLNPYANACNHSSVPILIKRDNSGLNDNTTIFPTSDQYITTPTLVNSKFSYAEAEATSILSFNGKFLVGLHIISNVKEALLDFQQNDYLNLYTNLYLVQGNRNNGTYLSLNPINDDQDITYALFYSTADGILSKDVLNFKTAKLSIQTPGVLFKADSSNGDRLFIVKLSGNDYSLTEATLSARFFNRASTKDIMAQFPYGHANGTAKLFALDMSLVYSSLTTNSYLETMYVSQPSKFEINTIVGQVPPVLNRVEVRPLGTYTKVMKIYYSDNMSGFFTLQALGYTFSEADRIWGDNKNGALEFIVEIDRSTVYTYKTQYQITITDLALNDETFTTYGLLPTLNSLPPLFPQPQRSIYDITTLYFKKQFVNVTNQEVNNTLYLNVTNADPLMRPQIIIVDELTDDAQFGSEDDITFTGYWDNVMMIYQLSNFPGAVVNVISNHCDYLGPLLSNATAIPGTTVDDSNPSNVVGWEFVIEDWPNGFKEGYMVIQSDYNPVPYAINFTAADRIDGDIYRGTYRFTRDLYVSSRIEIYTFTLQLADQANRITSNVQGTIGSAIDITTDTTEPTTDNNPPTLCSFLVHNTSVDVGQINRLIHVEFRVCDTVGSGVHAVNTPTVYISAIYGEHIGYPSKVTGVITATPSNPIAAITYSCIMNLPYGFGAESHLFFAIHGLFDNHLNINGYSTLALKDQSYTYNITRLYTHDRHAPISMSGGLLTVYGRKLGLIESDVQYSLKDHNGIDVALIYTPQFFTGVVFRIDIPPFTSANVIYYLTVNVSGVPSNTLPIIPLRDANLSAIEQGQDFFGIKP